MLRTITAVLILSTLGGAALAQDAVVPSYRTESYKVEGRALDILGFELGKTADVLIAELQKEFTGDYNSVEVESAIQSYSIKGVGIRLPAAPAVAKAYRANPETQELNQITVMFSGPASSSTAYYMVREVNYRDHLKSPAVDVVIEQLEAKYGKPIEPVSSGWSKNRFMRWSFKNRQIVSCKNLSCEWNRSIGQLGWTKTYKPETAVDYEITASVEPSYSDEAKASKIVVSVIDVRAFESASTADRAELQKRAQAAYDKANTAVSAPKF
ncbi:hypothetical protein [Microvirga sp. TS319]|uniref:hypothetical protein n=1 Tax=Microvirga sp. TS319 TaxID=3241165 RepID=UPI003519DFA4